MPSKASKEKFFAWALAVLRELPSRSQKDVRCRIDVVCAIGEDSRRQLERNLGASAHEGLVALAIREGRQQVRLSSPRPSGKENGRSSVGALRPRGSDGRELVLLPVPVGPPGVFKRPYKAL